MLVITTWNVHGSSGVDVDAVAEHLRSVGATVVALQEVQRRQARDIARALGWQGRWAFKHWPIVHPAEGLAILSAEPAEALGPPVRLQGGPLWSYRRRVAVASRVGGVALVNVHLGSKASDEAGRLRQVGVLLEAFQPEDLGPTVVAGDLNCWPSSEVLKRFGEVGLRDCGGADTAWTKASGLVGPPTQRLDYVLVSTELEAAEATVPEDAEAFAGLSDHLPVTVVVSGRP